MCINYKRLNTEYFSEYNNNKKNLNSLGDKSQITEFLTIYKTQFLPSSGRVDTAIWMYYLDAN